MAKEESKESIGTILKATMKTGERLAVEIGKRLESGVNEQLAKSHKVILGKGQVSLDDLGSVGMGKGVGGMLKKIRGAYDVSVKSGTKAGAQYQTKYFDVKARNLVEAKAIAKSEFREKSGGYKQLQDERTDHTGTTYSALGIKSRIRTTAKEVSVFRTPVAKAAQRRK